MKENRKRAVLLISTMTIALGLVISVTISNFAAPPLPPCYYQEYVAGEQMIPTGFNCYYAPAMSPCYYFGATTDCIVSGYGCDYYWCDIDYPGCVEGLMGGGCSDVSND